MWGLILSITDARLRSSILFFAVLLLLSVTLRTSACRSESIACCPISERAVQSQETATAATDPTTLTLPGQLRFHSPKSNRYRSRTATRRIESNAQALKEIAAELAHQITWPRDVDLTFEDCRGGSDAFYNDETHTVTICHEMVAELYELFSLQKMNRTKIDREVEGTLVSVLLHEVAHALIDVLNLPITGREEDAADQLSSILLINRTVGRAAMALDAAESFKLLARLERGYKPLYWDEHSAHAQRYYDTLCLVYGSDDRRFAYLVETYLLPRARAENCIKDYERISKSWMKLLQPYSKQSLWAQK
jgi:hypothetical protein